MDDRRFHQQAEALGLDGHELLDGELDECRLAPCGPDAPPREEVPLEPGEVLAGTSRARLRAASAAVVRHGKGLVVDHGVGLDPDGEPGAEWWARARVAGGRVVETVTVQGFENGVDALDALAARVHKLVRARTRRR